MSYNRNDKVIFWKRYGYEYNFIHKLVFFKNYPISTQGEIIKKNETFIFLNFKILSENTWI